MATASKRGLFNQSNGKKNVQINLMLKNVLNRFHNLFNNKSKKDLSSVIHSDIYIRKYITHLTK